MSEQHACGAHFKTKIIPFHSHSIFWKNFIALRDQNSWVDVRAVIRVTNVDGTSWISWYYSSYWDVTLKHSSTVCSECSTSNSLLLMHYFQFCLIFITLGSSTFFFYKSYVLIAFNRNQASYYAATTATRCFLHCLIVCSRIFFIGRL
jgi:hypothetical protein